MGWSRGRWLPVDQWEKALCESQLRHWWSCFVSSAVVSNPCVPFHYGDRLERTATIRQRMTWPDSRICPNTRRRAMKKWSTKPKLSSKQKITVQRAANERRVRPSSHPGVLLGMDSKGISRPNKSRSQRLFRCWVIRCQRRSVLTFRRRSVRCSTLRVYSEVTDRNVPTVQRSISFEWRSHSFEYVHDWAVGMALSWH